MWLAALLLAAVPDAALLERQAYRAYQAQDWEAAVRLYESFHSSARGTAVTWDNLGVARINLAQWEPAERALRRALELDPRHRWAYNHLGFVYREQGRHEQAVEMFRRQIQISPKDPYAYRNLAGTLILLGRVEEAERTAALHEQRTYERGAVYIDMACHLNARNQPEQASKYLDLAEATGADRSLLAQERGHHYLALGDHRRAEQQYIKLLEYKPYDPKVALRLGALYFQTGNLEKAAVAFQRVLSLEQSDQVRIRTSASRWKTVALAELSASAVLGDLPLDLRHAALLVRLEQFRRADRSRLAAACQELLEAKLPAAAEAWTRDTLGWALLENRQLEAAVAELERAHVLDPRRLTAYHLAVAKEKSGRPEEALALYMRSIEPLADTAIDCACEQPDLSARLKIVRAFQARLKQR